MGHGRAEEQNRQAARYDLAPLAGFANRDLALAAAYLQELAERV